MRIYVTLALTVAATSAFAQKKSETYKFDKITPALFQQKVYAIDSGASAVILADIGSTEIEGNAKGWFSFVFKRHKRVHILGKAGYDEATMQIPLYRGGPDEEEVLDNLKATAFNLENGQVTETKLSKDNIFTEKKTKNLSYKKFTVPGVKEGTIIDVEYKITSDYLFTLQPWDFQGLTPRLWSEYNLSIPQFFDYRFIYKGYLPFFINEKKDRQTQFTIIQPNAFSASERLSLASGVTDYRWVTRDVPGFRPEAFLTTHENYISHIELQLAAYKHPLTYHNFVPTWEEKAKELLKSENFGEKLDRNNGYLADVVKPLLKGSQLDQAKAIFAYVRDNFTNEGNQGIYLTNPVKDVFRNRKGSVAELNLLLVTMLRYANIKADPLMLSTRSNGTVFTNFPMISRFNYIIAVAEINGTQVLLDASRPRLGFNRLPVDCYNGMARMINESATPVVLMADSLRETKMTTVFLGNPSAKGWSGTLEQVAGYYESYRLRQAMAEKGKGALSDELRSNAVGTNIIVEKAQVDSLDKLDEPVKLRADIRLDLNGEEIIYLNPMLGSALKENPFKSAERTYPVEMPFGIDETYGFTLFVPDGYVVDELPKPIRMRLNEENDGSFEYLISNSDGVISMRTRIRLNRANYHPDEYEMLREFFNQVVAKHKEQIVLKKKK